jgi:hypothetical protein
MRNELLVVNMNWKSKTYVLWRLPQEATPDPEEFISPDPDKWTPAVEAFGLIYAALDRGRGTEKVPWLMTDEGAMYGPTEIASLQAVWDTHVQNSSDMAPIDRCE